MQAAVKFSDKDPKLLDSFEIIVAYFVEFFYMTLYESAYNMNSEGNSITEKYREQMVKYVGNCKRYMTVIIKEAYNYSVGFHFCTSLDDFEDKFIKLFIPKDFAKSLSSQEKLSNMVHIIGLIIGVCSKYASANIKSIIDDKYRPNAIEIRKFQDHLIEYLFGIREEYFAKITREIISADRQVPAEFYEKVQDQLKAERNIKKELVAQITTIEAKYNDLLAATKKILNGKQNIEAALKAENENLKADNANLRKTLELRGSKQNKHAAERDYERIRAEVLDKDAAISRLQEELSKANKIKGTLNNEIIALKEAKKTKLVAIQQPVSSLSVSSLSVSAGDSQSKIGLVSKSKESKESKELKEFQNKASIAQTPIIDNRIKESQPNITPVVPDFGNSIVDENDTVVEPKDEITPEMRSAKLAKFRNKKTKIDDNTTKDNNDIISDDFN